MVEVDPRDAERHMRERIEWAIARSYLQTADAQDLRDRVLAIIGEVEVSVPAEDRPHGVMVGRVFRSPGRAFRVAVQDKSQPDGPVLKFSQDEWRDFVRDVKDGRYDVEAL